MFCYVKHSKYLNVPFPRPFGATGNDARKLHTHGFARFRGALSAHEVLCRFCCPGLLLVPGDAA